MSVGPKRMDTFIGINFRGYKLSRFSHFFGDRESLYLRNRTVQITRKYCLKIQKNGQNSHENQKI